MKAISGKKKRENHKHFISHMVQMKVDDGVINPKTITIFISHMVQMKDMIFADPPYFLSNFISHMVQMKAWHHDK